MDKLYRITKTYLARWAETNPTTSFYVSEKEWAVYEEQAITDPDMLEVIVEVSDVNFTKVSHRKKDWRDV